MVWVKVTLKELGQKSQKKKLEYMKWALNIMVEHMNKVKKLAGRMV